MLLKNKKRVFEFTDKICEIDAELCRLHKELRIRQIGEQINFNLLPWAASFFNEGEIIGISCFGYKEYVIISKGIVVSNIVSYTFIAELMY